jgi:hypothetical protein
MINTAGKIGRLGSARLGRPHRAQLSLLARALAGGRKDELRRLRERG